MGMKCHQQYWRNNSCETSKEKSRIPNIMPKLPATIGYENTLKKVLFLNEKVKFTNVIPIPIQSKAEGMIFSSKKSSQWLQMALFVRD